MYQIHFYKIIFQRYICSYLNMSLRTSLRCALPAVRVTSVTSWCRETRAAPFSLRRLLWSAQGEGIIPYRWATSRLPSSSSRPDIFERETSLIRNFSDDWNIIWRWTKMALKMRLMQSWNKQKTKATTLHSRVTSSC